MLAFYINEALVGDVFEKKLFSLAHSDFIDSATAMSPLRWLKILWLVLYTSFLMSE